MGTRLVGRGQSEHAKVPTEIAERAEGRRKRDARAEKMGHLLRPYEAGQRDRHPAG